MSKIDQRNAFFDRVYELARDNRDVVVVVADMSAPALDKFRTNLPNQFVNVGIAEQNAILIASGMALTGKKVFAYAIAPFVTLRALEIIRVANGINAIPITIVGMGTGLSYINDGPTHHVIEDISILRALPNIKINNITDSMMAAAYADISINNAVTNYVRIDKDIYPDVYGKDYDYSPGLANIRCGDKYYIVTTGPMTHLAREIVNSSKFKRMDIGVIDIYEFPINEAVFIDMIKKAKKILTLEEHFLPGGLGSAVCEVLNDNRIAIPVKRMGMDIIKGYKYCYKYGGRNVIRSHYGIDKKDVEKMVIEFFR